jgi:hypothetical protein
MLQYLAVRKLLYQGAARPYRRMVAGIFYPCEQRNIPSSRTLWLFDRIENPTKIFRHFLKQPHEPFHSHARIGRDDVGLSLSRTS